MNVFDNSDIANYQDAVAKANTANLTEDQKATRRQQAEDKETDSYNETLRGILDPIGGELLRKPLEGLVHDTLKKGIKKLRFLAKKHDKDFNELVKQIKK